ncbi:MAG: hypothetical protein ABW221_20165 [Vicinamibacteria bacterium]
MRAALLLAAGLLASACAGGSPTIAFSRVPPSSEGGPERVELIEGRVSRAAAGSQVVLYARAGVWWVQPLVTQPYTTVHRDGTFRCATHLGTEYAALLVQPSYVPPARTAILPEVGGGVLARVVAPGTPAAASEQKTLRFGGYEWRARTAPSDRAGRPNSYAPGHAWTDEAGALHLRASSGPAGWICSELTLTRSLGYGTYRFVVRDTGALDPRTVLSLFTWDDAAVDERNRELDVEISRWGDPTNKNAQFVVQPYYMPANVLRFAAPAGPLVHTIVWERGRARFRTERGRGRDGALVAAHEFTSGVPVSGGEAVHVALYAFGPPDPARPIDDEVVIERFEYLP